VHRDGIKYTAKQSYDRMIKMSSLFIIDTNRLMDRENEKPLLNYFYKPVQVIGG